MEMFKIIKQWRDARALAPQKYNISRYDFGLSHRTHLKIVRFATQTSAVKEQEFRLIRGWKHDGFSDIDGSVFSQRQRIMSVSGPSIDPSKFRPLVNYFGKRNIIIMT